MKLWPVAVVAFVSALVAFAVALPTPPSLAPPKPAAARCASDPGAPCRPGGPGRPLVRAER